MSNSLKFGETSKVKLTPREKVRYAILGNRLGISGDNTRLLLEDLNKGIAKIFSLPETSIYTDVDFSGRDFDLVFTINKKDTPKNKS